MINEIEASFTEAARKNWVAPESLVPTAIDSGNAVHTTIKTETGRVEIFAIHMRDKDPYFIHDSDNS
jgi:hypothetical protein